MNDTDPETGLISGLKSRWRLTIGMKLLVGFPIVLGVFLIVGVLSYRNVTQLDSNASQVAHTHKVLGEVEGVLGSLVNIETGMRGFVVTGTDDFLEPYNGGVMSLGEHFSAGRELTLDNPAQTQRWDELDVKLTAILAETDRIIELRRSEGTEAASAAVVEGLGKAIMDDIRISLDALAGEESGLLAERSEATANSVASTKSLIVGGLIAAVIIVVAVGLFLNRSIAAPLRRTSERARQVSVGALSVEPLALSRDDELGDLATSFDGLVAMVGHMGKQAKTIADGDLSSPLLDTRLPGEIGDAFGVMVDTVKSLVEELKASSNQLAAAAEELSAVSTTMGSSAERTSTQAASASATGNQVSSSVATVAAAVEEMDASIREVARNATEASTVASGAVDVARNTSTKIAKLGESSREIGNVIDVINSIAEQTNLLALNATIEAARAGESGKGFAVVANEVKELANQTAVATEEISQRINAIQADTSGAVDANEQISETIARINEISTNIATSVEEQSETTAEIGRSVEEAANGSVDIAGTITEVAEAAEQTRQATEDTKAAADEMTRMASSLNQLVNNYN
ncbi:MAG: HAMP domain-containing protein [Actinomycetia bacterium]|nr:HAMP domain-containing protein [Actinomycetes bacterium]